MLVAIGPEEPARVGGADAVGVGRRGAERLEVLAFHDRQPAAGRAERASIVAGVQLAAEPHATPRRGRTGRTGARRARRSPSIGSRSCGIARPGPESRSRSAGDNGTGTARRRPRRPATRAPPDGRTRDGRRSVRWGRPQTRSPAETRRLGESEKRPDGSPCRRSRRRGTARGAVGAAPRSRNRWPARTAGRGRGGRRGA